jgi:hypothetical protein
MKLINLTVKNQRFTLVKPLIFPTSAALFMKFMNNAG